MRVCNELVKWGGVLAVGTCETVISQSLSSPTKHSTPTNETQVSRGPTKPAFVDWYVVLFLPTTLERSREIGQDSAVGAST
jgi:hypothetical protein